MIRYNHVHDTRRLMPGASVRGIMLDDEYAAVLIENNVLYDVSRSQQLYSDIMCDEWVLLDVVQAFT